jgi:hypothetical protein
MLSNSGLNRRFWAEATCTACYLIIRSPSIAIDKKTPIEVWSGSPVDYLQLRVFGCTAYAHVDNGVNTKIWYRKESDLWAQLGKKSLPGNEGFFKRIRQRNLRSAVCFRSAKGLFALISRDCVVTWPERKGRMDG